MKAVVVLCVLALLVVFAYAEYHVVAGVPNEVAYEQLSILLQHLHTSKHPGDVRAAKAIINSSMWKKLRALKR